MKKRMNNQKGFTLVESVMAMVVLSIGLWGGLATFTNATASSINSDSQVLGSQLAAQALEEVFIDKNENGYNSIVSENYPSATLSAPYTAYTKSVAINEVDPADMQTSQAGSGYKRVDVTITWGDAYAENVTVSTVFSNY